jgi:CMP-N,N'-diacetyllegionaminic acid synthase
MKTNLLITLCARGGSKGIPGKNIKLLNGLPLIAYSIKSAKEFASRYDAEIALSTDDNQIKAVAAKSGLKTLYKRPAVLANDVVGKVDVIQHVLEYNERLNNTRYDFILDLDITSPLRTIDDLEEAFKILQNKQEANNIFSVSPAHRNPYFNMVEEHKDGYVKLVKQGDTIKSRQQAPAVYDMNASFYFFRRSFFEKGYKTAITDKSLAYLISHLCFDLDHPFDFIFMNFLFKEKLLDFEI